MMPGLQEWIHKIEEGEGAKYIRLAFVVLALFGLTAIWHIREAKNYGSIEAMDAAQVARNLSEGKGFSTDFIRPLSIAMVREHRGTEDSVLKENHPDLANAPLYPALLAGLMKVLPFQWKIEGSLWRYQPEVIIGWFNQALFFLALFLVYRLAARLFDSSVGFLAAVLMALTEVFWEFTTSGLSTMLLIVLFLALALLLVALDRGAREGETARPRSILLTLAGAAGLVVGLMALTRYSMGWLILPVAGFVAVAAVSVRGSAVAATVAIFALTLSPWVARNYLASGHFFGTAGLAIHEGTTGFPGHQLERSMPKDVSFEVRKIELEQYARKLFVNGRDIVEKEFPQLAGNWIAALYLAALFVPYRNPILGRFKWFSVGTLALYLFVQALGRTAYSEQFPQYNSENLLVVFAPVLFIYGAAFFYTLLDQIEFPALILRTTAVGFLIVALSLPLIFRLLPPRNSPFQYPPYYAVIIQEGANWLQRDELLMTDIPWATAWYGQRQSVWTTLDVGRTPQDDFYRVHDDHKPVRAIYLTQLTTDANFLQAVNGFLLQQAVQRRPQEENTVRRQARESIWSDFYLEAVVSKRLPGGFPLKVVQPGWLPDQLFLTDRIRWPE